MKPITVSRENELSKSIAAKLKNTSSNREPYTSLEQQPDGGARAEKDWR